MRLDTISKTMEPNHTPIQPAAGESAEYRDPFVGSGTTAVAAKELDRAFVGVELKEKYAGLATRRISATKRESLLREISEQFRRAP